MSIENGNGFVPEQSGKKLIGWEDINTREFIPMVAGANDPYSYPIFDEEGLEALSEDIDEKNNDQWLQEHLGSKVFLSEAMQNYVKELLKQKAYNYAILDPRPGVQNPKYDLGIEVTNPKLASSARLGNLDPQHGPNGNPETSAIEEAMEMDLPEDGITMATIRPDMDSIGAMAVLELRKAGVAIDENLVRAIGLVDSFGPRAKEKWENVTDYFPLTKAANKITADRNKSIEGKVQFMKEILSGNYNQEQIDQLYSGYEKELEEARKNLQVTELIPDTLVLVEGNHFKATTVGYEKTGIIICHSPEFIPRGSNKAIDKWTIGRERENEPIDIVGLTARLNELEQEYTEKNGEKYNPDNTWGGIRGATVGSPQGLEKSRIPEEVIIETVKNHIPDVKYAESHEEYQKLAKEYSNYHGSWFGFGGEVWNEREEIKRQKEFEKKKKDLIDEYRGKIGGIETIKENIDGIRAIRKIVREQGKFPLDLQDTKRIFIALKKEGKDTAK